MNIFYRTERIRCISATKNDNGSLPPSANVYVRGKASNKPPYFPICLPLAVSSLC